MQSHIKKLVVVKITCSSWSWRFHSHVPLKQESTKRASNFTQMMACLEHRDFCGVKSSEKSKLRFFQCVQTVFSYPRFSLQWIRIENTCYSNTTKFWTALLSLSTFSSANGSMIQKMELSKRWISFLSFIQTCLLIPQVNL